MLNLYYQLQVLISNDNILEKLIPENNSSFKSIYKNITKCNNANKKEFTGAPLTKSGKRNFWPLQIILNELSFELKSRFVLLAGLLMAEREPNSISNEFVFVKIRRGNETSC